MIMSVEEEETLLVSASCLSEADRCQLLTAVDVQLAVGRLKADPTECRLTVSLDDRALWTQFHRLTNEMIVTKNGRYDLYATPQSGSFKRSRQVVPTPTCKLLENLDKNPIAQYDLLT